VIAPAQIRRALLALNTAGLLVYLFWLTTRGARLFYRADGVFSLLPCLPFFFVFLYLRHRPDQEKNDPD
jgi:hypothetical protein